MFRKYMHVERFGNDAVEGIELGKCYIFPKIDGTNGSVWFNKDTGLQAGSRNRKLSLDNDNAGFLRSCLDNEKLVDLCKQYPELIFYGEWLVPHSLKTYGDEAWRKFYIFDIYDRSNQEYLEFSNYKDILVRGEVEYISPIAILINSSYESLLKQLQKNIYLIKDGEGIGEGVVIKNYQYKNTFDKTIFAKIVTNNFKDLHRKEMGTNNTIFKDMVEQNIIDKYVTKEFIDKEYNKIKLSEGGWSSKQIPRLFNTLYHELIHEELWDILKYYKNPTINFKTLYTLIVLKVKTTNKELF